LALARAGLWWAAVIAILTSILTIAVMVRTGYRVFWGDRHSSSTPTLSVREVPARMWVPMVVLAVICGLLGIYPQVPYPLLDRAATVLATLGR
jgi:formate hydrogenlyase subunit 3/multisubunit Na+/H+ antiporter MnhD subunit